MALFATVGATIAGRFLFSGKERRVGAFVILSLIMLADLALVAALNWIVHGGILGSVNTARPHWNVAMLELMFLDFRAGLFTYAPIWMLSLAGVIAAYWQRRGWTLPAALYLVALLVTSAGLIGESYPARFWVQAVPVLALCLLGFTAGRLHTPVKALVYGPLFLVSLANTLLFFFDNAELHLAARTGSFPYDRLFELFSRAHLGFWVDAIYQSSVRAAVTVYCLLAILVVAAGSVVRSKFLASLAAILLLAGLEAHRVRLLRRFYEPGEAQAIVRLQGSERFGRAPMHLRLQSPTMGEAGSYWAEVSDGVTLWKGQVLAASMLYPKEGTSPEPVAATIRWNAGTRPPLAADVRALVSRSMLLAVAGTSDPSPRFVDRSGAVAEHSAL